MPSSDNSAKRFEPKTIEKSEFQRANLRDITATSGFQMHPATQKALKRDVKEQAEVEAVVQARVQEVLSELKSRAEAEGYQSGLKRGHEEALKRFQAQATENLKQLEDLVASAEAHRQGLLVAQEKALLDLVFQIAATIALKDIQADRDYIKRLISTLAEKIGARENIRVIVSLEDRALIEQIKPTLLEDLATLKHLSFEFSERVTQGGCILETDWATIDGRVQTQIAQIHDAVVPPQE